VVRGEAVPDTLTDRHSLAVVLFKIFIRHDPLMGRNYVDKVCLTEEAEKELYGDKPVFIFDPDDRSNEPVPGIHLNPLKLWPAYPDYIKEAFIRSFSRGMKNPHERLTEHEWQNLLIRFRSEILTCLCGRELFVGKLVREADGLFRCVQCQTKGSYPLRLVLNGHPVYLFPHSKLYRCHTELDSDDYQTVTGEVLRNKNSPGLWGIKNLSNELWNTIKADGAAQPVPAGAVVHISAGLRLECDRVAGIMQNTGGKP
jgi:hypothetical protein